MLTEQAFGSTILYLSSSASASAVLVLVLVLLLELLSTKSSMQSESS